MPTRIVSTNPKPARPSAKPQREPVLVLYRFADLCPYIEVWGNPERLQVHIAGTLYLPEPSNEEERFLENHLREEVLPKFWRQFWERPETRLLRTENIVPQWPSEEAFRQWRLRLLKAIEKLPEFFAKEGKRV